MKIIDFSYGVFDSHDYRTVSMILTPRLFCFEMKLKERFTHMQYKQELSKKNGSGNQYTWAMDNHR